MLTMQCAFCTNRVPVPRPDRDLICTDCAATACDMYADGATSAQVIARLKTGR